MLITSGKCNRFPLPHSPDPLQHTIFVEADALLYAGALDMYRIVK